ncbi:hypothetical protein ACQP3F_30440, partial [Escherichia coli]
MSTLEMEELANKYWQHYLISSILPVYDHCSRKATQYSRVKLLYCYFILSLSGGAFILCIFANFLFFFNETDSSR